jgi:hypothetical protein
VKNSALENFEAMLRNRAMLKTIEFVGLLFHYLASEHIRTENGSSRGRPIPLEEQSTSIASHKPLEPHT